MMVLLAALLTSHRSTNFVCVVHLLRKPHFILPAGSQVAPGKPSQAPGMISQCSFTKSDRHLTTFITPFGRWRYTRAPQGFLSSGDGYNRRFNAILAEFERKERCVDDTIFYDTELENHWWRPFLTLVGWAGIVLNPDKFQFAENKLWISPDLEFLNRLLSCFPSISLLSETFLSLRA